MRSYLNTKYLEAAKNNNMPIVKALLKYGQDPFSVLMVEYVDVKYLTIQ